MADHFGYRIVWRNVNKHMHMIMYPMRLHDLTVPGQPCYAGPRNFLIFPYRGYFSIFGKVFYMVTFHYLLVWTVKSPRGKIILVSKSAARP